MFARAGALRGRLFANALNKCLVARPDAWRCTQVHQPCAWWSSLITPHDFGESDDANVDVDALLEGLEEEERDLVFRSKLEEAGHQPGDADEEVVERELRKRFNAEQRQKLLSKLQKYHIGAVQVPVAYRHKITAMVKGMKRQQLERDIKFLREALRARTSCRAEEFADFITKDRPTFPYNEADAVAFCVQLYPAVFASSTRVFEEIKTRDPGFEPTAALDFGSGVGSATCSATNVWKSLRTITAVEPSLPMIDTMEKMLNNTDIDVSYLSFLFQGKEQPVHDVVFAVHSLSELTGEAERETTVESLWRSVAPGGYLAIVEPGTPFGFHVGASARQQLLSLDPDNAEVVAPCTHREACPMMAPGAKMWCHFRQRFERTPIQVKLKKNKAINWGDVTYSYIILRKGKLEEKRDNLSRIIKAPGKRGGHINLMTCESDGRLRKRVIARSKGKEYFRSAKKARLGDVYEVPPVDPSMRKGEMTLVDVYDEGDEEVPLDQDAQEWSMPRRLTKAERIRIEGRLGVQEKRRRAKKQDEEDDDSE